MMEITETVRRRTSRESAGGEGDGSSFGSCNEENPRKSSLHMLFPMTSMNHSSVGGVSPETKFTNLGSVSPNNCTSEEHHIPKWPNTPLTLKENAFVTEGVSMTKLMKRESYKAQRKTYRQEKKRVANELLSMLQDPSIIVLADWLKIRGTLKGWTKLWCVLKPGLFLLYKSPKTNKSSHWVGTILLGSCELIERPSKKNGFCFKLFHPLEQSIWATRGPCGETMGAMVQPLPNAYLIFRASSEPAGKCWMDALELALRCSSLLIRSMSRDGSRSNASNPQSPLLSPPVTGGTPPSGELMVPTSSPLLGKVNMWTDMDYEHHFRDHDLEDDALTDNDQRDADGVESLVSSDSESEGHSDPQCENDHPPIETPYTESGCEEFGLVGDAGQTEEVAEENKSLIWTLVKQVRPGMDLSKVVLPTFILEPRSFLDKLSDYHYHADIVSKAVLEDDPFTRMKLITQWYLSGFYKKPRGLKKPYNPILGEIFRCYWQHTDTNTRTFYIAEQVSHHPPVSAFYITNRKDGFCISGSILARSKFYGNSLSAILDGQACLSLLTRGEDYILTMPYAHCKGILLGTMSLELGGKVSIDCEKTGYHTELEFKLKPFLGRVEYTNMIVGKMKLGKETLATVEGHWDDEIRIIDRRTEESSVFWNPTLETRARRLKRFTVPMDHQREYESERLWHRVTLAIMKCDQVAATEEKTILEEAQRQDVKQRKVMRQEWVPRYFHQDINGGWVYNHSDSRPWDPRNDVIQFERDCVIRTKTRHLTPVVRISSSLLSVDDKVESHTFQRVKQRQNKKGSSHTSSTERNGLLGSDCSDSDGSSKTNQLTKTALDSALQPLVTSVRDNTLTMASLQRHMTTVVEWQGAHARRDWILIVLLAVMHSFLYWVLNHHSK